MAETPTEITVDLVVPIYTRFNGKEIELGEFPVSVPIKVEIGVASREDPVPESWDRWQDVPNGVTYQDRDGDKYVNRDGVRWWLYADLEEGGPSAIQGDRMNTRYAPFVRTSD